MKYKNLITLAVYSLLLMAILYIRIHGRSVYIPSWDGSHHLQMGFSYYEAIKNLDWREMYKLYAFSEQLYPPMYHILIAVSYLIFGVSGNNGLHVNVLFIPVLIFSTYLLGKTVFDKKIGLISALLVPILPMFLRLEEVAYIDYMNISLFIFSFYIMFKTNYFRDVKYSLIFGVLLFINLLTKWPIIIPSLPFFIYLVKGLVIKKEDRKRILLNLLLIFSFLLLSLTWYYSNYTYMIKVLDFYWNPDGFAQKIWSRPALFSLENILLYIYPYGTGAKGFGIIPLGIFFAALFLKTKNKLGTKNFYILASILVTYLVLTYLNDKADKYTGYIYPLIVIYTVGKTINSKNKLLGNVLICVFCVAITLNMMKAYLIDQRYGIRNTSKIALLPGYESSIDRVPWPTKTIVEKTIATKCKDAILVLPDHKEINAGNIIFFARINHLPVTVIPGNAIYDPSEKTFDDFAVSKDYGCIITKTGNIGEFANRTVASKFENYLQYNTTMHADSYEAPDKSIIRVYYWGF